MEILIVCVNYNSYSSLANFLCSVEKAALKFDGAVSVFIADNSEQKSIEKQLNNFYKINIKYYNFSNLGYFGGAFSIINGLRNPQKYDYVFITNVDLVVDENFFCELQKITKDDYVAWIAPSIFSKFENRDKNPQRIKRCSKIKLQLLYLMFSLPILERFYSNVIYLRRKNKIISKRQLQTKNIYCGHGSFIILTKEFIKKNPILNYPCFLFCEELFLGEIIKNEGLKVIYEPSLKIFDDEHVSTGKLPSKNYYRYNRESLFWILRTFYK